MDCTICDAGAAHLLQLEALERACFSAPWTRAQLASQLPDDRHVFLIAAAGETVLATSAMSPSRRRTGGRASRTRGSTRCARGRRRSISHF